MLAEEATPQLEGNAKIKAMQEYIQRMLEFDHFALETQRLYSFRP